MGHLYTCYIISHFPSVKFGTRGFLGWLITNPSSKFRNSKWRTKLQKVTLLGYNLELGARVKKRLAERVFQRVLHIIRSETMRGCLASAKSLAKSLAEGLTKSLDVTQSPRVSDRIISMALRKTVSETRFFYAGGSLIRNLSSTLRNLEWRIYYG